VTGDPQIVAVGARTPIGLRAETAAAAVRAGISRVRRVDRDGSDVMLCIDPSLGDLIAVDRMIVFGISALSEVLAKLASGRIRADRRIPVLVGLPEERPGWGKNEVKCLLTALRGLSRSGVALSFEPLPWGHAAAIEALRLARERVRAGSAELVIVGGADSYHDPDTLAWLRENRQWSGDEVRAGFAPGEGAGFVAVMHPADVRSTGFVSQAAVGWVASASETKLIKGDAVALGEGLTAAVSEVVTPQARHGILVEDVYCDINGERYRSEEWGFVALRQATSFRDPSAYCTAVGRWGDVGAATGALNLVLATQAWKRNYASGDNALIWGSSEGGLRSAALLSAPPRTGGSAWAA
jgi:3-oxoacyl-[acyl-carrier-protein] synthase I